MGWTGIARDEHNRESLRYPSDLTNREWVLGSEAQRNRKHGVIAGAPSADVIAAQSVVVSR